MSFIFGCYLVVISTAVYWDANWFPKFFLKSDRSSPTVKRGDLIGIFYSLKTSI